MTRKKFVKMLMSMGITRDMANDFADAVVAGNSTYDKAYRHLVIYMFLKKYTKTEGILE